MKLSDLKTLAEREIRWEAWEAVILANGITIDRPRGARHPHHPNIIYPIDYGFVNGTLGTDGQELDLFRGSASTERLVGTIITVDYRKGDCELKLLYDCSPEEIYLVNGFVNFDRDLMEGILVPRYSMQVLWDES